MKHLDPNLATLWLQFSGLPAALNKAKANGWLVFKTLVELDCRRAGTEAGFEVELGELAERCGLEAEALPKILEALRKRKVIRLFLPDTPDEPALVAIAAPLPTPLAPRDVAARMDDPHTRDPATWRYTAAPATGADESAIQHVVDLYLNHLSQRVNSFVIEQIEVTVARFSLPEIERMIERAAKHNVRTMGWVIKELVREERARKTPKTF